MKRSELREYILDELKKIETLFSDKNAGYGDDQDGLYNFRETARRHLGDDSPESMYKVLAILRDKHEATLAKNGLRDSNFEERTRDDILYGLISLAMWRASREDSRCGLI